MQTNSLRKHTLFLAIAAASGSAGSLAQDNENTGMSVPMPVIEAPVLEEMLVTGRLMSGAQSVVDQRLQEPFQVPELWGRGHSWHLLGITHLHALYHQHGNGHSGGEQPE